MFVVISYDIGSDQRRLKVARTLEDFGERVQYSVFECILQEEDLKRLLQRLQKLIDPAEDSIRIYKICQKCIKEIKILGAGEITREKDLYII